MLNKLKEFLYLGRLNNPTGALLLAYPCFWGVALAKPDPNILFYYTIAFFIGSFSMRAAGCTWNDIQDRDLDKLVMRTKNRPIASGDLSIIAGLILSMFCIIVGGLLSYNLGLDFLIICLSYFILNLLYSFYLKKIIVLDVIILMSFYTIRIIAGHFPHGIPFSPWLLSFSIFLFFSLGLLKRYIDIRTIENSNLKLIG
ncbi:uncharacterized protein METZ01_LOCUS470361, partial [marine metagenome]